MAQRLDRFTDIVGRDRVIAGSDCGFGTFAGFGAVDPEIAWAKLATLAEGARARMTPLVLLPGMMCDARLYGPQIAALSGSRAVHLAPIGGHDTMAALAAEVLAHAPPRFALAGLSMGGIVAMEILRQAPDRVERLALLDTNPRAETPEAQARREPQIAKARAGDLAERHARRDEAELPRRRSASVRHPRPLPRHGARPRPGGLRAPVPRARRPPRPARRPLAAFRGPTLVLTGEDDRLCPRDRHELMHALIPGSRLAIIPGAGHLPTLEQPEATTNEIIRWLSQ